MANGSDRRISLRLLGWYHRSVSPLFPARCKFYPTCSAYAETAIRRFGILRGGLLAALRLLRCQPWVDGGVDDVPERFSLFYRSQRYQQRQARTRTRAVGQLSGRRLSNSNNGEM